MTLATPVLLHSEPEVLGRRPTTPKWQGHFAWCQQTVLKVGHDVQRRCDDSNPWRWENKTKKPNECYKAITICYNVTWDYSTLGTKPQTQWSEITIVLLYFSQADRQHPQTWDGPQLEAKQTGWQIEEPIVQERPGTWWASTQWDSEIHLSHWREHGFGILTCQYNCTQKDDIQSVKREFRVVANYFPQKEFYPIRAQRFCWRRSATSQLAVGQSLVFQLYMAAKSFQLILHWHL